MISSEVELGTRVLEDALVLLTERGYPQNGHTHVREDGHRQRREPGNGEAAASERLFVGTLFGSESRFVYGELVAKFREREQHAASGGYIIPFARHVLPIYRDRHYDAQGFILAGVDHLAGARVWPAVTPRHEIALSVSLLGAPADRIRFLGELTCIYSDAIRLSGQGISLAAPLIRSLSDLVALLRIELRENRNEKSEDP